MANFAGMAESFINARIVRYYTLPFTQDVPYLTGVATRKALHLLLSQRLIPLPGPRLSELLNQFATVDEEIKEIANGDVTLIGSDGAIIGGRTDVAEVWTTTKDNIPTFWEGPATLQVQDQQKLQDEADKRDVSDITERRLKSPSGA